MMFQSHKGGRQNKRAEGRRDLGVVGERNGMGRGRGEHDLVLGRGRQEQV